MSATRRHTPTEEIAVSALVALATAILVLGTPQPAQADTTEVKMQPQDITLKIIYDNNEGEKGFETAWGFSCLVEGLDRTILFDTGGDGPTLMNNMAELGIAPDIVDVIVLSHEHQDHVGGLGAVLEDRGGGVESREKAASENRANVGVYVLKSFPESVKKLVRNGGAELVEVEEPVTVFPGVMTTGEMRGNPGPNEQSLIITTEGGLIILTGCAHPGIVEIVERAKELTGGEVLFVIGGFHLFRSSEKSIRDTMARLKDLGVEYLAPVHCSGDRARDICREVFGERHVDCAVGRVIAGSVLTED
jgi:7,8-dihydropterin-6-yl-methyl-4-(beta-D-ribofuranosyl)aminobenzene 5'-phosphate synthase